MMQRRTQDLSTIAAVAFLAGCMTPTPYQEKNIVLAKKGEIIPKIYTWEVVPFVNYNPPSAESFISLDEQIARIAAEGFDVEANKELKPTSIKNFMDFSEKIYRAAARIGFSREYVAVCSPRIALDITCKIIAERFNYFGDDSDFQRKRERNRRLNAIESIATNAENKENGDKDHKKVAGAAKNLVQLLRAGFDSIDTIEGKLGRAGDILIKEGKIDELSVDELWENETGILCRHYGRLAEGIFFVFKQNNPRLQNTHVSCYVAELPSGGWHLWNQVMNVQKQGSNIHVLLSYFDPTTFDVVSDSEGCDSWHFKDLSIVRNDIKKLEQAQREKQEKK